MFLFSAGLANAKQFLCNSIKCIVFIVLLQVVPDEGCMQHKIGILNINIWKFDFCSTRVDRKKFSSGKKLFLDLVDLQKSDQTISTEDLWSSRVQARSDARCRIKNMRNAHNIFACDSLFGVRTRSR